MDREEIRDTLFSISPLKALGPDGLHALFFQSQWDTVGGSLCNLILNIFQHLKRIQGINQTFLSLIPKVDSPEFVKHFRPISLCNVVYKVITKILANRLKKIMPTVITPN